MKRHPALSLEQIAARLVVDMDTGRCFWRDATKHHRNLNGTEAGGPRRTGKGEFYWVIKIDSIAYKRAQIVLMVKTGHWPTDTVDHENGNKLDDHPRNLRHATATQNAQNHKRRAKKSPFPMGVKQLPSGRFAARIACERKQMHIGTFDTPTAASAAYMAKRKELFREYA